MNFNASATHLQLRIRLPKWSAGVWVNTPKGGAAVTQGLMTPYLLCPRINVCNKLQRKQYWKEAEGSRLFLAIKTKNGLGDSVK